MIFFHVCGFLFVIIVDFLLFNAAKVRIIFQSSKLRPERMRRASAPKGQLFLLLASLISLSPISERQPNNCVSQRQPTDAGEGQGEKGCGEKGLDRGWSLAYKSHYVKFTLHNPLLYDKQEPLFPSYSLFPHGLSPPFPPRWIFQHFLIFNNYSNASLLSNFCC